jgi:hypothetical protein
VLHELHGGLTGAKAESELGYHEEHEGHEVSVFEFQVLSFFGLHVLHELHGGLTGAKAESKLGYHEEHEGHEGKTEMGKTES